MKVIGLDGREYVWPGKGHGEMAQSELNKSGLHKKIYEFLKLQFPLDVILQEIPLPGTSVPPLRLDFFIPNRMLAVEADGEQHYKFVPFFHETMVGFRKAQARDKKKLAWLENNNIQLVRLPENAEWECLLKNVLHG